MNHNYSKLHYECACRVRSFTTHYYGIFCLIMRIQNMIYFVVIYKVQICLV